MAFGPATRFALLHALRNPADAEALLEAAESGQTQAAVVAALTDNGGGAAADGTIGAVTPPTAIGATLTDSTGLSGSHDDTVAAITNSFAGYVYYQNIAAATTSAGADQLDVSGGGGAMANIVQPDVPRNVVINFTDADASISAFQVDVVGTAPDGSATAEQFLFAGGLDQTGSVIHAKITSVTVTSITGNAAADTLDLGYGDKVGVPVPAGATGLSIVKLVTDGTEEAASATDTTNNSFTSTTAPNGTRDFEVWFEYSHPALTVMAQNTSDLAQKVIELVATQAQNRTAIVALQDAVKELSTKINAILSSIKTANLMASA